MPHHFSASATSLSPSFSLCSLEVAILNTVDLPSDVEGRGSGRSEGDDVSSVLN